MRLLAGSLPGPSQKNPFIVLGVITLIFVVAYELAQYVIAGDTIGLTYIAVNLLTDVLYAAVNPRIRQ